MDLLTENRKLIIRDVVCNKLEEAKKTSSRILVMNSEDRERFVLSSLEVIAQYYTSKGEDLADLLVAICAVSEDWPQGTYPEDSTLMLKLKEKLPYYTDVPLNYFDMVKMSYSVGYGLVMFCLKEARALLSHKNDLMMMDHLERIIKGTFITNPNFNGSYPYYKRYPEEMNPHLWKDLLEKNFDNYISYFKEVLEDNVDEPCTETIP